jgi:hypothetical protein
VTDLAFYAREGDRFVPTGTGVSPWNGHSQNGVALAGLVAHRIDAVASPVPMHTARLTIDILGAVPMAPLDTAVRVLREGKRIQLIELELRAGDRAWVRASAVRMRTEPSPAQESPPTRLFPETPSRSGRSAPWLEMKDVQGDFAVPGPGARWVRFAGSVVAGHPLSPLERVAMLADFGSGSAPLLPIRDWTLANIDISIHLTRLPRGEWLLIDSASESAGNGVGITHSRLSDRDGLIARGHQTVFLDRRTATGP